MSRPSTLLPVSSSSKATSFPARPRNLTQQKFTTFATTVITRAEITTPTLLLALVYINRARPYLHIALEEWALERVFLGALIVASKYANDSTLKNVHWALCTGVFGKRDVGRIEREFLGVLEWELGVSENEVLALWAGLEWAVEEREREERQKQAKQEKEQRRQLELLQKQQQKSSGSKFFLYDSTSQKKTAEPAKPRNHRRSIPAPLSVTVPAEPATLSLPIHHPRTHGHSPSSSSLSSSSSSSSVDSPSPTTPEDFQTQYIVIEDGETEAENMKLEEVASPQKKRGFGATTMDLLKSFPFPGHSNQSSKLSVRNERELAAPHPYAYTLHGRYATDGSRPVKRCSTRAASS
ncbi:hypothetical protein FA15DRAFT_670463 [Coprinopsis marcescibilis]|uniref:Cyclin N-terminal domain-containing protein n=1 Tax=Coprinopsis marcescibilis TaxID=230819 RepID=A0A5C3KSK4_COPMA|nr:hypothetical protein FA15DRAFT_670463 [Coprinopsis marcescibilis]